MKLHFLYVLFVFNDYSLILNSFCCFFKVFMESDNREILQFLVENLANYFYIKNDLSNSLLFYMNYSYLLYDSDIEER